MWAELDLVTMILIVTAALALGAIAGYGAGWSDARQWYRWRERERDLLIESATDLAKRTPKG
jgi:hypothetical protein